LLALAVAASAALAPPPPAAPLPREPAKLAASLAGASSALDAAIDAWGGGGATPREVTLYALYQQRVYRLLGRDSRLAAATLARLRPPLRTVARDVVGARHDLSLLTPPTRRRSFRTGPAAPARALRGYYGEAERRFHVRWQLLAAVNFVESGFGRLRSSSSAGAQGPMQFLPSTWRAYGLGGDVHDPRDAILGAANYLHASGAPRDERRALLAYNHSSLYVDAVLRFARRMERDPHAYYAFYSWQVFVRTPSGDRRLTGPGLRSG
jgi:membrane-bound lytic murein transglycosylase B